MSLAEHFLQHRPQAFYPSWLGDGRSESMISIIRHDRVIGIATGNYCYDAGIYVLEFLDYLTATYSARYGQIKNAFLATNKPFQ